MVLLEAKVMDSTHLELSRPILLGRGSSIVIAVAEAAEPETERGQWADRGIAGLATACGETEPDYTTAMIRRQ